MGILALLLACAFNVQAAEVIWDTQAGRGYTLEEFAAARPAGSVLVFGERHADATNENEPAVIKHHENQVRLLEALTVTGQPLTVGMEFLKYTTQDLTDRYLAGTLAEDEFIKQAWGGNPFEPYRWQILMPRETLGGRTLALNAPADLSRQVAKGGPDSLSAEQRTFLPPLWERGGTEYFERFVDAMGGHGSPAALENYFWAQSLWDDTMAWKMKEGLNAAGPNVIIAGEFHTEFGHGLPARLRAHGVTDVATLLQVEAPALDPAEIDKAIAPDDKYGTRADFIWIHTP